MLFPLRGQGALVDRPAIAQDQDLGADLLHLREYVAGEDHPAVDRQFADQEAHLADLLRVQPSVGSSRITRSGSWMMAWARPRRWR